MIKGILIYSTLLGATILLALFLSPSKKALNGDSLANAGDEVVANNEKVAKGSMPIVLSPVNEQVVSLVGDEVGGNQFEADTSQVMSSTSVKQSDNLASIDEGADVLSEELRAQELAYLPPAPSDTQSIDFEVTPNEMLDAEKAYSEGNAALRSNDSFEDELVPTQNLFESTPVDTTIPTEAINYEQMESERLYQQKVEAGQIQPRF